MQTALNHMTTPGLSYVEFLDLAARLGCIGVEVRNDLERPLFDGLSAGDAGQMARDIGLRLIGLSQVYPFNDWNTDREAAVRALIETAKDAGAETISLIPRNDGTGGANGERQANLRVALKAILPMLQDAGLVALVEPLGFWRSSLRSKADLVDTIDAIGGTEQFKLVHDTFHHTLAAESQFFPAQTGIVHISGVTEPSVSIHNLEDEHRVLVDADDRLDTVTQICSLTEAGYEGPISYECFSPLTHDLADPYSEIKRSFEFISSRVLSMAA
jgi:2-keto-myo-inositol isomerase